MKSLQVACAACNAVNRIPQNRLADHPICGRCRNRVFGAEPIVLDAHNFRDQVLRSDLPVLVDFWAPWCGPCQVMAPVLEQSARECEPGMRVAKLDTEVAPELAGQFAIRSIPTLVVFRQGREVARRMGAMSLPGLLDWLQPFCQARSRQRGAA